MWHFYIVILSSTYSLSTCFIVCLLVWLLGYSLIQKKKKTKCWDYGVAKLIESACAAFDKGFMALLRELLDIVSVKNYYLFRGHKKTMFIYDHTYFFSRADINPEFNIPRDPQ